MAEDARTRLKEWLASGQAKLQPLTLTQRELWETSPVPPASTSNHICSFFEIQGPLTREGFEAAVARVVERQDALRTSFLPGKERPLQIVRGSIDYEVGFRGLAPGETSPEALASIMDEGFRKPFDFLFGPLFRIELMQRGEGDFIVAFTIHHALGDGWTLGAFVADLCAGYLSEMRGGGALPALTMGYTAWGARERAKWTPEAIAKRASYWKGRLVGAKPLFESSADRSQPLERWATELPAETRSAIESVARKGGATLFSALLGAFQVAVHRWCGAEDFVVGSPVANRREAAVAETMGSFSSVVPIRGKVTPGQAFPEHLAALHEHVMDAFEHAVPFAELAALLGETSTPERHAVFDTRFAFQNHPVPDIGLPGVSTELRVISTGTARFDLGCELTEVGDGFELVWLYRPGVVTEERVRGLDAIYREALIVC